jgi:transposase-like protein
MERKAPKHVLAEVREDFHEIVYAASAEALASDPFELLTFFSFPKAQWKTLRTTNVIERLNEEFRRRVKTQGALPTEDSALILLFGLIATGQITLRKLDGYKQLAAVIRMQPAA